MAKTEKRPAKTTSTSGTPARSGPPAFEDAVEFVEVHKAFGRNKILRGLNMGIPKTRSR